MIVPALRVDGVPTDPAFVMFVRMQVPNVLVVNAAGVAPEKSSNSAEASVVFWIDVVANVWVLTIEIIPLRIWGELVVAIFRWWRVRRHVDGRCSPCLVTAGH